MAQLKYADLSKRDNANKFIDKAFGRKGDDGGANENNWAAEKVGQFFSESVTIGNTKYTKYDENLPTVLTSALKSPTIILHGRDTKGDRVNVRLTHLDKTAEFGGQGSKGNAGHKFERVLDRQLRLCTEGKCCTGKYADETKHLIKVLSESHGSAVANKGGRKDRPIEWEGKANKGRPLIVSGESIYIEPKSPKKHGPLLTDITVHMMKGGPAYLSLKSTDTVTFVNAGVTKHFLKADEIKKGQVTTKKGEKLLQAFGINNALFCKVFNDYERGGVSQKENVTNQINKSVLEGFMATAIGAGYHMIHEVRGKITHYWVGEKENGNFAKIVGNVIVHYGGLRGGGKRIDIEFGNTYYNFKVNIRNKQGGKYPSHIMMDYTPGPGLTTLKTTL
jgi:plastocyanin